MQSLIGFLDVHLALALQLLVQFLLLLDLQLLGLSPGLLVADDWGGIGVYVILVGLVPVGSLGDASR